MDITKLDEYEGDRMKEAIEWAKDQRDAGKFLWNRCIPEHGDPIPYAWTTKASTSWEDHSRMIEIADFYEKIKQFKAECHEFFKGHRLREEDDGEGGTRCTTCMKELGARHKAFVSGYKRGEAANKG